MSMRNAPCIRSTYLFSLSRNSRRHASHRSFERPLSRPSKRNALPPPKNANLPSLHVAEKGIDYYRPSDQDRLRRAIEELKKGGKEGFFTDAPKIPRPRIPLPPWLKWLLTPGKLAIYCLVGYAGYRLYRWQVAPGRSTILNRRFFYPFIVESREPVSSTSAVINLQNYPIGQNGDTIMAAWRTGVWSVQIIQPELQVARFYTPLPPTDPSTPASVIRLFVREEPFGEVSRMLHREPAGSIMHLRGPFAEFEVPDGLDEILFLAGGTGIAPALQVAHCLYKARGMKDEHIPKMKILWANRRREDSINLMESEELQRWRANLWDRIRGAITSREAVKEKELILEEEGHLPPVEQSRLVDEVEKLVSQTNGKISIEYFVDEEGSYITERSLRSFLGVHSPSPLTWLSQIFGMGEVPSEQLPAVPTAGGKLLLLAGPDGFIDHFAGPKIWAGGKERPGPLGGVLRKINPPGWDIWSL